jgi:DNA primase
MEKRINDWLLARKISQEVIDNSGLMWNGKKIVIPVKDMWGKTIFNKYRRDPNLQNSTEPKYTYDAGASGALFNIHTITKGEKLFIVEGELDALLLTSCGLRAVSSTGGSSTFKDLWAEIIKEKECEVYICYDRDMAGFKGALRVQQMLPKAKIIFLPYTLKGKDVTDFFFQYKMLDFIKLVGEAESWIIPEDKHEIPSKKGEVDEIIKTLRNDITTFDERKNELNNQGKVTEHVEIIIEILQKRIDAWTSIRSRIGKKITGEKTDVSKAKLFPILNLIKFNNQGFAKCIFHGQDDTPSLKYYPKNNVVHCFACQVHEDSLSVYMKLHGCGFKEAVKALSGVI